jgi:hypothetical protein
VVILGVAMAVGGVRLLPKGHSRHDFAVVALITTLILLALAILLRVLEATGS